MLLKEPLLKALTIHAVHGQKGKSSKRLPKIMNLDLRSASKRSIQKQAQRAAGQRVSINVSCFERAAVVPMQAAPA